VSERLHCFALHAERLEVDRVWDRTRSVLNALEHHDGRGTLFVHPFSAIDAGYDLTPRIRELVDRGHEVAQHTHFYAVRTPGSPGKLPTDLSEENIHRCLDRDLSYLRSAGVDPKGFTSGGWAITPTVVQWLEGNGFVYDCSYRSFDLKYRSVAAEAGGGKLRAERVGKLVNVPTTIALRDAALGVLTRRHRLLPADRFEYELVYAHDYDLVLGLRARASRMVVAAWSRGPGRWMTAGDLATTIGRDIAS
jgi:peptidoglycan/xylan/chitin deacetylase (PgdA/CDA1 family)